jgi:hypothetical protein
MACSRRLSKLRPDIAGLKGVLKEKPMRFNLYGSLLPALAMLAIMPAASAQTPTQNADLYVPCSFYPQGTGCEAAYRQALHDDSPAAASVRAVFQSYARYLKPDRGGLTEEDKRYLAQNDIQMPFDLTAADTAGLHNVINDGSLAKNPDERRAAVNAFIGRAVQAELYCGTSPCQTGSTLVSN